MNDRRSIPVKLQVVLFVVGLVAAAAVVGLEIGSRFLAGGASVGSEFGAQSAQILPGVSPPIDPSGVKRPPGLAISYLALVDAFLFFVLALQGLSLVISQQGAAKVQGVITFVVSLLWVVASLLLALVALSSLLLMVGLFLAFPFGTLAYLAVWGFFPVSSSAAILGLVLLLKLIAGAAFVIANPRFLVVTGLVILFLLSLLLQVVLTFLHGSLPGPVVSIGDALWALVTAVVALVWALITLIGAVPAVLNALRSSAGTG